MSAGPTGSEGADSRTSRLQQLASSQKSVRLLVLAAVEAAVLLAATAQAATWSIAVLAMVLLPVGAWVSWRNRNKNNVLLKILISVGAVAALVRFFGQLTGLLSFEDARVPLADLFLVVQVLHGFDLPRRRDLGFTFASSLTLVALAAAGSRSTSFLFVLLPWMALAATTSLVLTHAQVTERLQHSVRLWKPAAGAQLVSGRRWAAVRRQLRLAVPVLVAASLVFTLLPRTAQARFGGLPFSGLNRDTTQPGDGIVNPDSGGGPSQGNPGQDSAVGGYAGFADQTQIGVAPKLTDELVMRVRANSPQLWRGVVFDTYSYGGLWSRSDETPKRRSGLPVVLDPPLAPDAQLTELHQTYELVGSAPNLIFAVPTPVEVFSSAMAVDPYSSGTLTTPGPQDAGTVYSVVSMVNTTPPSELRQAGSLQQRLGVLQQAVEERGAQPVHRRLDELQQLQQRYTQTPADLDPRVGELAAEVTAGVSGPYAKAEAVQDWLGANTEYALVDVNTPAGADVVSHFLFESQAGWCEPIASSMVMMLRTQGVPARYVTGFVPGLRNPFTGWFEVKQSDAHSWVEVYVAGQGWVPFDPTSRVPGASSLYSQTTESSSLAADFLGFVGEKFAQVLSQVGLPKLPPLSALAAAAGVVVLVALGLVWRRRKVADRGFVGRSLRLLSRAGAGWQPAETPRQWRARLDVEQPEFAGRLSEQLDTVVTVVEAERYASSGRSGLSSDAEQAMNRFEVELSWPVIVWRNLRQRLPGVQPHEPTKDVS